MTPDERRAFLLAPIKVGWLGETILGGQGRWAGSLKNAQSLQQAADDWEICLNRNYVKVGRQARPKAQDE